MVAIVAPIYDHNFRYDNITMSYTTSEFLWATDALRTVALCHYGLDSLPDRMSWQATKPELEFIRSCFFGHLLSGLCWSLLCGLLLPSLSNFVEINASKKASRQPRRLSPQSRGQEDVFLQFLFWQFMDLFISCCTSRPVSTGMGNRLRATK